MDDPLLLDHLLPFRQYADYYRAKNRMSRNKNESVDNDDLQREFQKYKDAFIAKTLNNFFKEQKESEW
jgi:hypothetical protein